MGAEEGSVSPSTAKLDVIFKSDELIVPLVLHEFAHLAVAQRLRVRVFKMELGLFKGGLCIERVGLLKRFLICFGGLILWIKIVAKSYPSFLPFIFRNFIQILRREIRDVLGWGMEIEHGGA